MVDVWGMSDAGELQFILRALGPGGIPDPAL